MSDTTTTTEPQPAKKTSARKKTAARPGVEIGKVSDFQKKLYGRK